MPNLLQFETSPYLLQHANNPVHWQPWSDKAFEQAKAENKPVLISIGYAACHWCHVMEHESFENEVIANYMNEHFINIKVDREEHPDVDHFYMDALQSMTGSGGWPLNMFVDTDRKPFYGGTYFPPEARYGRASWIDVLKAIHNTWQNNQEEIQRQGNQMLQHLQQATLLSNVPLHTYETDDATLNTVTNNLLQQADNVWGGFGAAPKFPATGSIAFLLDYAVYNQDTELGKAAKTQALLSLDKMIDGGIYDQIGGGFSRYATDNEWLVPHFEKMLYDNALLITTLCKAFRITQNKKYEQTIQATIAFCNRELRSKQNPGYFCALDADSEGIEGLYYTWTWEQWQDINIHPAVAAYFGVSKLSNWEHTNILHRLVEDDAILDQFNLNEKDWYKLKNEAIQTLFTKRQERIRPATDDKILLSWNALMNIALCEAAETFPEGNYLTLAEENVNWLLQSFVKSDGGVWHTFKNGQAKIEGKLDDYAYLIQALLKLGGLSGNTKYFQTASKLLNYVNQHFCNETKTFYYFSSMEQTDIPVRKVEVYDGATPSANAVMMQNLWHASLLFENHNWNEQSLAMLFSMKQSVMRYPTSFGYWAVFLQHYHKGPKQMVISGVQAFSVQKEWSKMYQPHIMLMYLPQNEKEIAALQHKYNTDIPLLIYVCGYGSCLAPVSQLQEAIK